MTLNMLLTCRWDPTISAYKSLNGLFDYNKTPLAPLGSPAAIYDGPTTRNTFSPHCTDAIYVAPSMLHYWKRKYWVPSTQKMRISSSARIYPEHWKVPTILEADKTFIAESDHLTAMKAAVPYTLKAKLKHAKALQNLTAIIENTPNAREDPTATPTVSTPTDATSPKGDSKNTHHPPTTDTPQHTNASNKWSQRSQSGKWHSTTISSQQTCKPST